MGDDHFAPVYGKESVVLEFSSKKSILFNMLYVPKLRKNLISGPVLNKCGYKHMYEFDNYILSKSGVFIGSSYYNNGMFMLNLNKVPDDSGSVYMSSSTIVNSSSWYARLGHVNYKRMLEMSKDDLIPTIDKNLKKCTTCCKPLGCKWIFKKKMKVDGIIDKFKARVDMEEADVILGYSSVSTPMDPVEKLKPNTVGRLSRFTSNPSRRHWHVITRVFKYLKGTINYDLSYVGYPLVLEAYLDTSWINHVEVSSSTSGWVFLLGEDTISWNFKKQTCITGSTIEYEFIALATIGKEAEWLRNLIH
uniref:Zinc finger, CCHC-type n=1 Tax=Tanacetum cinerariifolium TaxID=118510 RepID=A0A699HDN2_TANCI|nr:zinc finger, CCHC-type [Tanacetum cinerariifolium]